ncbi:bifunctional [glutamate--ammonia ligase]-adenylyl-L-tyrosine phosphorylase/[glutamate--ammonia-ligase] adenylyltransferase [Legionella londiniensis]|uniref:Adenylyl transferase n=1 Tax=Legionella londiniensis TaxID=45068 RepID=A0A0W0VP95_9GAMM|nr:bifunctional [glutamate--ammonia ligase]-adenylyl-L-tyrosine phosphorylase/[glutamate--ammonia-ligase] adenylyltransferase [Legionella londiniensis]KTD21864.1 adenylyl transferase [Legionella londiniensis]STX92653.1 adenylyl transferase [Legionella londiniensis]
MKQNISYEIPEVKQHLISRHFPDLQGSLCDAMARLLYISEYACRHISILQMLVAEDDLGPLDRRDYFRLVSQIPLDLDSQAFAYRLRIFRHRHLLRIVLREQARLCDVEKSMSAWSDCADALILHALKYCNQALAHRYGTPCSEPGISSQLYTIAMGKLGGKELNYSSDIDLIFVYTDEGFTNGREKIFNQQYYSKLIQKFLELMQCMTKEGFVFRVDLRLRPNGESGPLVTSLSAMETYYQEQGRDWERYAMVKARVIQENEGQVERIQRVIAPFVYRRYVDFSVIESLRGMKAMIAREVLIKSLQHDIKRGPGGIREIEFIIQSFQLIRGGRLPNLCSANAIQTLESLHQGKLLDFAPDLKNAYLFLRRLENVLQIHNDRQTHTLPDDRDIQRKVALAMNFDNWEQLSEKLGHFQEIVTRSFQSVLSQADIYTNEARLLATQMAGIWHGHVEESLAVNVLSSLGYENADRCYQILQEFRHAPRCRRLSQAARLRLARFMMLLLQELASFPKTDAILLQVIRLLEKTVTRSAYLALLTENPKVLQELLRYFAVSPFIAYLLVEYPFLLEVLLDEDESWRPPDYAHLRQMLQMQPGYGEGEERQGEILRQFKLRCWLLIARAELNGHVDAITAGRFLANVAQLIIIETLLHACRELKSRFPEIRSLKSHIAVIAYGKLGSREMNYDSDVDLVFLHTAPCEKEPLVNRLVQKIIHSLTLRTQMGTLYAVDTRLRPSGSAGLLVSSVPAYIDYQYNQAWVWEHQALLKARVLFGSQAITQQFVKLKKDILFIPRNTRHLAAAIQEMRKKIKQFGQTGEHKAGADALLDLEFLTQYLILANPNERLARKSHTLSQINQLLSQNILDKEQWLFLRRVYQHCHQLLHEQILRYQTEKAHPAKEEIWALSQHFYNLASSNSPYKS